MNLEEKISRAKAKLLVDYPLFGTLASRLELLVNDDIQAFKSNGIKLEYNSEFVKEISISELEFVFANGAMHASLAYENRKNNRSGWLWQLASDYSINDMLVQNGLERPYQAHYSKRFEGLYAEEIYAELKADILRDELEYETDDLDDVNKNSDNTKDSQTQLDEQLFEEFSKYVIDKEKDAYDFPESLDRFFNIEYASKIDWRVELRNAIDKYVKDDYTLMPPNKKFLFQNIYLPSAFSQTFNLVIAIDSSGSINNDILDEFLSEVDSLFLHIQRYKIDLLVCDDKVRLHKEFFSSGNLNIDIKGGGGTDFRPVFEFIEKNIFDAKLLLYFSDLDGVFPKESPNYEVKWISSNIKDIPFGEIIQI